MRITTDIQIRNFKELRSYTHFVRTHSFHGMRGALITENGKVLGSRQIPRIAMHMPVGVARLECGGFTAEEVVQYTRDLRQLNLIARPEQKVARKLATA
ncbi:MAG: hypothetical protein IJX90_08850 [Blautia sp.]|nr:hypothetical protein [Blautia sp.]